MFVHIVSISAPFRTVCGKELKEGTYAQAKEDALKKAHDVWKGKVCPKCMKAKFGR